VFKSYKYPETTTTNRKKALYEKNITVISRKILQFNSKTIIISDKPTFKTIFVLRICGKLLLYIDYNSPFSTYFYCKLWIEQNKSYKHLKTKFSEKYLDPGRTEQEINFVYNSLLE
jgi:hypothetical protein